MDSMTPQRCIRCLYDSDVPSISFDEHGTCSYCRTHDDLEREYPTGQQGERLLNELVAKIKHAGRGNEYDCVVGVSGGCDSSFLLHKTVEMGLRPLAVHFDNTWNSTVATQNIRKITQALDVDLFTHVVNNREYDDIYRAFFSAGVPDIEAPTDLALAATLSMAAERYRIRYIIEGHSFRTEGISPLGWLYMDDRYVRDVHRRFGSMPLSTYPHLSLLRQLKWMIFSNLKKVRPLYYIDYQKEDAKQMLSKLYGWEWYGGHHLDNRFTAFYHRYFIPRRFNIDLRLLGHSALVRSKQLDRDTALAELEVSTVDDPGTLEIVDLVIKRLGFDHEEFERLMNLPRKSYRDYKNYKRTFEYLRPLFWLLYKLDRIPKSFYMKFTSRADTAVRHRSETGPVAFSPAAPSQPTDSS